MNLTRITRLLKLLQALQSGTSQNASGLAKTCGVSRRTIFRDLETLKAAGVPLQFDPEEQRYMIPGSFFLPPTNLTAEETLSVIALCNSIGAAETGLPFYMPALRAAQKLESNLAAPLRDELHSATRSIHIRTDQINRLTGKDEFYQQLVDSISKKRVLRLSYDSFDECKVISTKLRPYDLLFCRRSWYVIGRSSLHREVRTFNLGRIVSLKQLSEKYSKPRTFSLTKYLGNAWQLIPDSGSDHQVVIHFKPLVAKNVAEVVWHKTQELQFLEDGSLEFRATVSGLDEIEWWILHYGDQAEVLKPATLRKRIALRVRHMQSTYNGKA